MCFKLFKKNNVKRFPANDENFQREVLEQMQVKIDDKVYLKADDLMRFIGADSLSGVLSRLSNQEDLLSIVVAYKLKGSCGEHIAPLPEYTRTNLNFKDSNIHYAFDATILPFLKQELENDPNGEYLCEQVKRFYDSME